MGAENGLKIVNFAFGFHRFWCKEAVNLNAKSYQMLHFRNILISLAAVVFLLSAGCHHESAMMQDLSRIDSMVYHQQEQEALPLLQQMDTKPFSKEERAYHAVLLSMAQYKNYVPCGSDSAINEAVSYFKTSGDDVKYLKALVAQGCVNEDMGNLEAAVQSYHHAEGLPLSTDSSLVAYAKLRLGMLYQHQIIGSSTLAVDKIKGALALYESIHNAHYELVCLGELGSLYRGYKEREKQDSCLYFLAQAYDKATALHDTYYQFSTTFVRAEYYELIRKDYLRAKTDAVNAINIGHEVIDHPRAHLCAASSFLHLGQTDSAKYYLDRMPPLVTAPDSVKYYNLLADIAKNQNNTQQWEHYKNKAQAMADSVLIGSLNHRLLEVEKKYDVQLAELDKVKNVSQLRGTMLALAGVVIAALALLLGLLRYRSRLKIKENEAELLRGDLDASLASLEQMQTRLEAYERNPHADEGKKVQSDELRTIINQQIDAVHQLMGWSYQYDSDKFAAKFREMMTVPGEGDDSNYWSHLQTLVNELHDNVLVKAQEAAGGTLNESELNLLALYCCGFSRTVIMVAMGYKNIGTVYNKKIQIAKKLHVNDLDEFVG